MFEISNETFYKSESKKEIPFRLTPNKWQVGVLNIILIISLFTIVEATAVNDEDIMYCFK